MSVERTSPVARRTSLMAQMRNVVASVPGTDPARRVQLTLAMDRFLARLLTTTEYEFASSAQKLIGPPGGALRFPIRALLAGSEFVRFGADVNSSDAVVGKLERHSSDPLVVRLGYPKSRFPVYPIAQQFAEKLHAFTCPRDQENTRAKDLADMIWFVERYPFASAALIDAGVATFGRPGGHHWPPEIPNVPVSWSRPYAALRKEMGDLPGDARRRP